MVEDFDEYRVALELVITTVHIRDRLPQGNGELVDQFNALDQVSCDGYRIGKLLLTRGATMLSRLCFEQT